MAHVGLFEGVWRDLTGRGMFGGKFQIRLIAQPLIALLLGIRFGIRDAKAGKEDPFFMSLVRNQHDRWPILKQGLRDAIAPLCVAFILDSILQRMILGAHSPCGGGDRRSVAGLPAVHDRARALPPGLDPRPPHPPDPAHPLTPGRRTTRSDRTEEKRRRARRAGATLPGSRS